MKAKELIEHQSFLQHQFQMGKDMEIENSPLEIRFFPFSSKEYLLLDNLPEDNSIAENQAFLYPVFQWKGSRPSSSAIFLMHGLNERSWSKYLSWAEYLCWQSGRPVVLFPIAFHINRSPMAWSNPRTLFPLLQRRWKEKGQDLSQSVANLVLSERLCKHPLRFYNSGRQTLMDLFQLIRQIKEGRHPLFKEGAKIDFFSYSIGALLTQIALMSGSRELLGNSNAFLFCGGSLFREVNGESKYIMDHSSCQALKDYYLHSEEWRQMKHSCDSDEFMQAFDAMIGTERLQSQRKDFFKKNRSRLKIIALRKDRVMPYTGIVHALGETSASVCARLEDFPFAYTHENPFPFRKCLGSGVADDTSEAMRENHCIASAFFGIFEQAAQFLS